MPADLTPPGRTAGGGAAPMTAGAGPKPGVAGSPSPYESTPPSEHESQYSVHLERGDGETRTLTGVESVDIKREHTQLSDWSVDVPEDPTLPDWKFAHAELRFRGERLFEGRLRRISPSLSGATTTLEGYGPGGQIRLGRVLIDEANINLYQAIELVWARYSPLDALVLRPDDPQAFSSITLTGSPKDVLQTLHERAGMRFYFTMGESGPDVVSFRPGQIVRPPGWTQLDVTPTEDVGDYRNVVTVEGAYSDELNRHYQGHAEDADEIADKGERLPESIGPEPQLTSDADCQQVAEQTLQDRVAEDGQSGTIDILPRLFPPGVRVPVPYYDGEQKDIERVSYGESQGDASGSIDFDRPFSVAERTEEIDADLSDTKELIR